MNLRRIYAVFLQEFFITRHSLEVVVDVFIFPLINIVIFGLISLYLVGDDQTLAGEYVLLGMLLWQIIWIIAYSVAVGSMWNIWSKNLSNMFIAPLRLSEYITAHFLSGCLKSLLLLCVGGFAANAVFHFDLLSIGIPTIALVFFVFALFAFSIAIAVLGLIFRYGTRLAALSWSLIMIFQPLSAAFFPLSVMPAALQVVARLFPPTYAFEAARYALEYHEVLWRYFFVGSLLDLAYVVVCVALFRYLFDRSRDTGQFARNES